MGWFDELTSGFNNGYKRVEDEANFNKKSLSELKRMLDDRNLSWDERKKIEKRIWEKERMEEYQNRRGY